MIYLSPWHLSESKFRYNIYVNFVAKHFTIYQPGLYNSSRYKSRISFSTYDVPKLILVKTDFAFNVSIWRYSSSFKTFISKFFPFNSTKIFPVLCNKELSNPPKITTRLINMKPRTLASMSKYVAWHYIENDAHYNRLGNTYYKGK